MSEKVKKKPCPKCGGELEEDLYNGRVFCRQCHWCGYWDRGYEEKVKPKCARCGGVADWAVHNREDPEPILHFCDKCFAVKREADE